MYGLYLNGSKVKRILKNITDESKYDMVVETLPPLTLEDNELAELCIDSNNQLYYEKRKKETK